MSSSMRTQSETSRVARRMSRAWLAGISTMFPSGEAWATDGEAPFRACDTTSRACTVACQPASPTASDTIVVIFMLERVLNKDRAVVKRARRMADHGARRDPDSTEYETPGYF